MVLPGQASNGKGSVESCWNQIFIHVLLAHCPNQSLCMFMMSKISRLEEHAPFFFAMLFDKSYGKQLQVEELI